jgi:Flp pilus assembly protein TadG
VGNLVTQSRLRLLRRTLAARLRDLIHDESGSYLVFMTILMPVLIGVAALGTEGAEVLTLHRQVHAAADSAAVSVASYYAAQTSAICTYPTCFTHADLVTQAQAVVATYPGMSGATVTVNSPPALGNFSAGTSYCTANPITCASAFEVIVSQSHSPLLSSYWLPSEITVTGRAVALINVANGSGANCAQALGISSDGTADQASAITANGSARLNVYGCSVGTNSRAGGGSGPPSAAINLVETNGVLGGRVSAVGGVSIATVESCTSVSGSTCNGAATVAPLTGAGATPDPYASTSTPSASTCLSPPAADQCTTGSGVVIPGWCISSGTTTLSPGTYCGGISSSGNAQVTLRTGVYVLASTTQNETGLTMANGTTLDGTAGTTLVFTETSSSNGAYPSASGSSGCSTTGTCMMDIANGASMSLTAPTPTSGATTAGFVIMGDRSMPVGTVGQSGPSQGSQFVIENGATATLGGVVYLPNGALSFEGNGGATTPCTQIIANVFDLNNSGNLNINCSTAGGGTAPLSMFGAVPLLVE